MSFQLRFLKSNPIGEWLNTTAVILEKMIPHEGWRSPPPTSVEKIGVLKKTLAFGLLSFVSARSLCGSDPICDSCCAPAAENKNPFRLDYLRFGETRQYLVEQTLNLKEMSHRLTQSLILKLPEAVDFSDKIQGILSNSLASHLFENIHCHQVPICQNSGLLNLRKILEPTKEGSNFQSLDLFFKNQHQNWEKKVSRTLLTIARKYSLVSNKKKKGD